MTATVEQLQGSASDPFGGAWFAYMVRCADGTLYTGVTNRLLVRIDMHNAGDGAKYTRGRGPVHLVWSKLIGSKSDALREEARIKRLTRPRKEEMLPWHSPTAEVRDANVMLWEHIRLCPPPPEGINADGPMALYASMVLADAEALEVRKKLVRQYAWATPTEAAMRTVLTYGPVVEMGAGTGYWAWLMGKLGGDVAAYDKFAEGKVLGVNPWNSGKGPWTGVRHGTPSCLRDHPGRTLFLCWPPGESDMASRCLKYWDGNVLAYAGDRNVTAEEGFLARLADQFELLRLLPLPSWPGIRDRLEIWKRKP